MSRARRTIDCPRDPVGLSQEEAAAFVGVSPTHFERAVAAGLMPAPREFFGRMLWDAEEVYQAFRRLPRRGKNPKDNVHSIFSDVAV